jgi:hypothetical protein
MADGQAGRPASMIGLARVAAAGSGPDRNVDLRLVPPFPLDRATR